MAQGNRRQAPRSVRNNNPGNIRNNPNFTWQGQTGVDSGGFAVFDTPENGSRAMARLLQNYQGDGTDANTVNKIIHRWAPPNENDTGRYAQEVADAMGVGVNQPVDLSRNPELQAKMMDYMTRKEGGARAESYFEDSHAIGIGMQNGTVTSAEAIAQADAQRVPTSPRPEMSDGDRERIAQIDEAIENNLIYQNAQRELAADQAAFDEEFGATHNPDGTAKVAGVDDLDFGRPTGDEEGDPYNFQGAASSVAILEAEKKQIQDRLAAEQAAWDEQNAGAGDADDAVEETIGAEDPDLADEFTDQFNAGAEDAIVEGPDPVERSYSDVVVENWMTQNDLTTYKWTFYLVKSNIWNQPTVLENDDSVTRQGDAVVIAESGVETAFAIENMLMLSKLVGGTGAVGTFQFDLYEPYGFTFMDRLVKLQPNFYGQMGLQSALFVLKLEFLGRDPDTGVEVKWPGKSFFYPCTIREMKGNVDASGSRYNIVAFNTKQSAEANVTVVTDIKYTDVGNVESLASSLQTSLNEHENDIRNGGRDPADIPPNATAQPIKQWEIIFAPSATGQEFNLPKAAFSSTEDQAMAAMLSASNEDPNLRDGTVGNNTNMKVFLERLITANVPEFARFAAEHREQGYRVPYIHVDTNTVVGDGVDPATNNRQATEQLIVEIKWTYTNINNDPEIARQQATNPTFQNGRFDDLPISKVYRYLYSGENTQLVNFDLTFDTYFFNVRDPGLANTYAEPSGVVHPGAGVVSNNTSAPRDIVNSGPIGQVRVGRFLSDIKVDQDDMAIQIPSYGFAALGSAAQQVSDIKNGNVDTVDAVRDAALVGRDMDFMTASFEIVGDPFWMGAPGAVIAGDQDLLIEYADADTMIVFINYLGKEEMYEAGYSGKADMDLVSSGVYRITDIESKFSQGQFTQILKGYKDTRTTPSIVKNKLENIG